MQTEKRVNVPDLRDVLAFWEMKDAILDNLKQSQEETVTTQDVVDFMIWTANLINKIESIGKKEGE